MSAQNIDIKGMLLPIIPRPTFYWRCCSTHMFHESHQEIIITVILDNFRFHCATTLTKSFIQSIFILLGVRGCQSGLFFKAKFISYIQLELISIRIIDGPYQKNYKNILKIYSQLDKYRAQLFTSLKADLRQDINRGFAYKQAP